MKEIDFLPKWYKSSRRRQVSYRTQCVGLAGIFVVMMVWNFAATHSISKATAALVEAESKASVAESVSWAFGKIKSEVTQLQKKAEFIEEIDSKIDVAGVLAEISFLVDKKIVLSKVEFGAERFAGKAQGKVNGGTTVRVAWAKFGKKGALPLGDVRFKVVISGVAADARDVAKLTRRLEDSPYFCLVYPSFSRNRKINAVRNSTTGNRIQKGRISNGVRARSEKGRAGSVRRDASYQVSEFEIGCYLANYREE